MVRKCAGTGRRGGGTFAGAYSSESISFFKIVFQYGIDEREKKNIDGSENKSRYAHTGMDYVRIIFFFIRESTIKNNYFYERALMHDL